MGRRGEREDREGRMKKGKKKDGRGNSAMVVEGIDAPCKWRILRAWHRKRQSGSTTKVTRKAFQFAWSTCSFRNVVQSACVCLSIVLI